MTVISDTSPKFQLTLKERFELNWGSGTRPHPIHITTVYTASQILTAGRMEFLATEVTNFTAGKLVKLGVYEGLHGLCKNLQTVNGSAMDKTSSLPVPRFCNTRIVWKIGH